MAKKKSSRRPNVSLETLERARAELRGEISTSAAPVNAAPNGSGTAVASKPKASVVRAATGLASRRLPTPEELKAEYGYVLKDLRNLLVLAGALFAFIIVMAAILPSLGG